MSTSGVWLCGVPEQHCTGGTYHTDQLLPKKTGKAHESGRAAQQCMKRYLVRVLGYEQVSAHDFAPPDGGPVKMLGRPRTYGCRLRSGKSGEKGGRGKGRFMPQGPRRGSTARGVIIAS